VAFPIAIYAVRASGVCPAMRQVNIALGRNMEYDILIKWAIGGIIAIIVFGFLAKFVIGDKTDVCPHCNRKNVKARNETGKTDSEMSQNYGLKYVDMEYKCLLCEKNYWIRNTDDVKGNVHKRIIDKTLK
jgi:DNA-directed RNA polymerase subunit RPC12/RpoP